MRDLIVEQVRRARKELIEQYGGIDGYFQHCQAQERAAVKRSRRRKRPVSPHKTLKSK